MRLTFGNCALISFQRNLPINKSVLGSSPLHLKANDGQCSIYAPNQFVLEWVKDRFDKEISLLAKEHLRTDNIEYLVIKKDGKKNP